MHARKNIHKQTSHTGIHRKVCLNLLIWSLHWIYSGGTGGSVTWSTASLLFRRCAPDPPLWCGKKQFNISVLQQHVSDNSSSIHIQTSLDFLLEEQYLKHHVTLAKTEKKNPLISCSQSEHQNLLKTRVSFHLRERKYFYILMVHKPKLPDTLLWNNAADFLDLDPCFQTLILSIKLQKIQGTSHPRMQVHLCRSRRTQILNCRG